MLNIKSAESFRKANKKTTACALLNIEDRGGRVATATLRENAFVTQEGIEKCLYGDIPESYRVK